MIEQLSIDLTNYCTKQCDFCYNHSNAKGSTFWKTKEVVKFSLDCIDNGVKAISLGGGEPFEYAGIFKIIEVLYPFCYLSITSNGLPLDNPQIKKGLKQFKPDKIHLSIHYPDNNKEINRIERQIKLIESLDIKAGVNLLISKNNIKSAKRVYSSLKNLLSEDQIILVPIRSHDIPSPSQVSYITEGKPFQSPTCLLGCRKPENFCSVSWDKKVNWCSFAKGKIPLRDLSYKGLIQALSLIQFSSCQNTINS